MVWQRVWAITGATNRPVTRARSMNRSKFISSAAEQTYSFELEYPTDDWAILADRIAVVTEKVRAGLATRQRGALRIACCLALADHPPLTFEIGFFAPTLDAVHMSGLLVSCIENRRLPSSVTRITLSVTLSGPLRSCQNSLFQQPPDAIASPNQVSGSSLSRMVDALSGRLGRDAVLGVSPSDDPLPEKAYQLHPADRTRRLRKHDCRRSSVVNATSLRKNSLKFLSFKHKSSFVPRSIVSGFRAAIG